MKPEDLTVEMVEKAIQWPVAKWKGSCYAVACAIVEAKLVKGRAVYGHYKGPVANTGFWSNRKLEPFHRHGWIVLSDGRILDPTRWCFEDRPPYIAVFEAFKDYDEGGNEFRALFMRPCPAFNKDAPVVKLVLKGEALETAMKLLGSPPAITKDQIFWLANLPPDRFGKFVKPIFKAIVKGGFGAYIPFDNRQKVGA